MARPDKRKYLQNSITGELWAVWFKRGEVYAAAGPIPEKEARRSELPYWPYTEDTPRSLEQMHLWNTWEHRLDQRGASGETVEALAPEMRERAEAAVRRQRGD